MYSTRSIIGVAALLALTLGGCEKGEQAVAPPPPPAPPAPPVAKMALPADLTALKTEAEKGKAQLDLVLASLDATVAAADGDPRPPFAKFQADLKGLTTQTEAIRARAEAMKSKGKDYFKTWESQLAAIATPEIKKAAEARREELAKFYDAILTDMAKARETYDKQSAFMSDMAKVMENDLNAQGLKAIAPKVNQAKEDAKGVKGNVDAILADLEKISAIYSPGK